MGMAEYENQVFVDPQALKDDEMMLQFRELHKKAEKLHFGDMGELERHKQIMDKLNELQSEIMQIKKHFNITTIIGE